jgi:hypothetical protein
MKINHYAGPEHERDRITLTAMYLDEKAKTWFNNNIKGDNCQRWVWTFKNVITGLYDRFIHKSSIQDVTQNFYSVKYTTDGSVFGFYHELVVLPKSGSELEQTQFKLQTGPEVRFRFSNSMEPNHRSSLWFWPLWNCRTVFECGSNHWNRVLFHVLSLSFKSLAGQVCWTCKQIWNKKSLTG